MTDGVQGVVWAAVGAASALLVNLIRLRMEARREDRADRESAAAGQQTQEQELWRMTEEMLAAAREAMSRERTLEEEKMALARQLTQETIRYEEELASVRGELERLREDFGKLRKDLLRQEELVDMNWRAFTANAPYGRVRVSPQGAFLAVNAAAEKILRRPESVLRAMTWQEVTDPEDVSADAEMVRECLDGRREHYAMEKRYRGPKGEQIPATLWVDAVRGRSGAVQWFDVRLLPPEFHRWEG